MKILFISDNFPPEVNAPATRTFEHTREWVKLGHEVTVITCAPNFPQGVTYEGYKNKLYQREIIDGIVVIRVWTYIAKNEGFVKRIIDFVSFSVSSFISGLFVKTDIIVATSPQFFAALSGKALGFWRRKPWVMEVRDIWPESIKTVGAMKDNLVLKYFEWLEIRCYKSSAKIIVVTKSFKKNIIKKGIDASKIKVVTNGANLDLFNPVEKNIQLTTKLKLTEKIILGYTGTHGMAHKLDFIMDCAKQLDQNNIHILFIGDGSERNKLLQKVADEKIKNVTMIHSKSKIELLEYMAILDGAIINLKKDKLFETVIPSKIFENAAMGIPILIGVDGEAREIIENYNAGFFYSPENEIDFINKVRQFSTNKTGKVSYQLGGLKLAKAYDRKVLAKELLKELIKVVGSEIQ